MQNLQTTIKIKLTILILFSSYQLKAQVPIEITHMTRSTYGNVFTTHIKKAFAKSERFKLNIEESPRLTLNIYCVNPLEGLTTYPRLSNSIHAYSYVLCFLGTNNQSHFLASNIGSFGINVTERASQTAFSNISEFVDSEYKKIKKEDEIKKLYQNLRLPNQRKK